MVNNFEYFSPTRVIFGKNSFNRLPGLISGFSSHVLVVTGKKDTLFNTFISGNADFDINPVRFSIHEEPTVSDIEAGIETARKFNCKVVAGIGGGSVIDAAKAIAAIAPNNRKLTDYLEIAGLGIKPENNSLPCIAVPTTAGTGSEVTRNAVIKSPEHKIKVSLRNDSMYPVVAVIDPELTLSMSPQLTASTGMDALTHLFEVFTACHTNSFTDTLCAKGLEKIALWLETAYHNGANMNARENMSLASMLGGMALANGKLGAVHGFASPIGGMYNIPHGVVCATLLPHVTKHNIRKLEKLKHVNLLNRYSIAAQILTGNADADYSDLVRWFNKLTAEFKIQGLKEYNISSRDFDEIVSRAASASSMKGNPVVLGTTELMNILTEAVA